mmetsp:Transcript_18786/g.27829  ORF Transcript_18786/g.27829 Transcript_18786/m.27829 type:complete len:85 (+) Transcript_18786:131-385(+)
MLGIDTFQCNDFPRFLVRSHEYTPTLQEEPTRAVVLLITIRTSTEATTIRMIMDLRTTIVALEIPNIPHPPEVLVPAMEAVRNR